jgi:predicted small secreted protein
VFPRDTKKESGDFDMRTIIGIALASGALLLAACNTVEGVGKDVKSAGDTVAKTADKNK